MHFAALECCARPHPSLMVTVAWHAPTLTTTTPSESYMLAQHTHAHHHLLQFLHARAAHPPSPSPPSLARLRESPLVSFIRFLLVTGKVL
jgi:hypothetical protein